MYEFGGIDLCLHCGAVAEHISNMQWLKNAAMANRALDDMDAVTGFHTSGGRVNIPAMAMAMRRNPILNNIQINNSQVGVLNTGTIEKIDATITLTRGSELEEVGNHLKAFTEALLNAKEVDPRDREDLADLLETLTDQINRKKPASIAATMAAILDKAKSVLSLFTAAQGLWAAIKIGFGIP